MTRARLFHRTTAAAGFATLVTAILAVALLCAPAAFAASPRWQLETFAKPTVFAAADHSGADIYETVITNVGDAPTNAGEQIVISDQLSAGLKAVRAEFRPYNKESSTSINGELGASNCTVAPLLVQCTYPGATGFGGLRHGEELLLRVHVEVLRTRNSTATNEVTLTGGGAPAASASTANAILESGEPAPFGLASLDFSDLGADGTPSSQAGAHPFELTTRIQLNNELFSHEELGGNFPYEPTADARDVVAELPAGFIGNPSAVPLCSLQEFSERACPLDTQIGTAVVLHGAGLRENLGAYNLAPQPGQPAAIGIEEPVGPKVVVVPALRTGGDYGLRVTTPDLYAGLTIEYLMLTVWGVPAAPSHDLWRGRECGNGLCTKTPEAPSDAQPPKPYLTNPTSCPNAPLHPTLSVESWEEPGHLVGEEATWPAVVGCNQLQFQPTLQARPTTNLADAPSGLNVDLGVPQNEDPEGLAEAELKEAVVTLPKGMVVNPASASGLGACSEAQASLHTEGPAQCPDASKLGTVAVETPLLDHPLPGAVYLAKPNENPFHSLLALYIAVDDPQTGVIVKLAGKVTADPETGQLSASFTENPQLPFEHFKLKFFPGAQAPLRTPATCGGFTTTSQLTPWSAPESGPPATPGDQFEITAAENGGPCPGSASALPNQPSFHAGTEAPQAGKFSPFALKLVREDGSQEFGKIETTLPPGLTGKLAGVAECSEAQLAVAQSREHEGGGGEELAAPSCPSSSDLGVVNVGAGAGPDPYYVQGHAYLAGPYKGAPLSLAIVTPAVAGPFDLGTVVVRTALYVDPFTAQIRAVSDPIPHILDGIPLDVRSVTLQLSRPDFTLNPTNCNELSFTGAESSLLGNAAPLSQRFQVGGCQALPFKPKLRLALKGGTKRHTFPALTATLTMPPGQANVGSAQVTLPANEQLEQAHITSQVCLQAQLATRTCPKASIYGYAKAETPLLDQPLEGPVYLGVGFGHKLPDLVAELNGQIRVLLHGKVDTGREDGIRNTFEVVPDAPVSKFTLHMYGGHKGLIVNSENLCGPHAKHKALATFSAQNGKVADLEPTVANSCKKHSHHRQARRRAGGGAHNRLILPQLLRW